MFDENGNRNTEVRGKTKTKRKKKQKKKKTLMETQRWWNLIKCISICNSIAHTITNTETSISRPTIRRQRQRQPKSANILHYFFFVFIRCVFSFHLHFNDRVVTSLFISIQRESLPISGFIESKMRIKFHVHTFFFSFVLAS